ncbi:MAG: beta-mannanase [Planctomycetes bacterium]|nr:beta-mannanase [Planctomycetota bacterium]
MKASWVLVLAALGFPAPAPADEPGERFAPPREGRIYHGVYPGGRSGEEEDITREDLAAYEEAAGRKAAWVYFSHNWYAGRAFPVRMAEWIRESGAVPFVRLMLRSNAEQGHAEPVYHVRAILAGTFDEDLRAWARAAKGFGTPLLAEWGTEMNGEWFSWNGKWNGAGETRRFGDPDRPDGPERFAAAFRRIVEITRKEGAANVSWAFHVNASDGPAEDWNRFEEYYPGDDVVDWVGVSAYGAQIPPGDGATPFREAMDACVPRIEKMAPGKRVLVLEFGCTRGCPGVDPGEWGRAALADLLGGRWPTVAGFAWWNEEWENDDLREHDTNMQLQDVPAIRRAFRESFAAHPDRVEERPRFERVPSSGAGD